MKQVTFITPPSPFLLDERVFPALGILKVAAVAEQLGYRVSHLDLNGVENYEDAVRNYCASTDTMIFALTATTPQMVAATKIRKVIRETNPKAKIIIGGPHPTLVHAACRLGSVRASDALHAMIHYRAYDVIVAGDGERAIGVALEDNAPMLIDADNPKSALFLTSKELVDMPLPARHLIDMDSYHYTIDGVRVTPLIAQLGCPFGCNFCAGRDSAMLRRVRLRPTESVLAEMRAIYERYGVHGFMFFDDELNVNPNVLELLTGIRALQDELGVEFRCRGFVKSELFTKEQASAMYQAGFRRVMCGFESGSDRILKNINKRATKAQNTHAMELSHRYGLEMKALMSIGHPGESYETVEETLTWLKKVEPSDFDCTIITAYPGSPYYDRARRVYGTWPGERGEKGSTWAFDVNGDTLYMYDIDYTRTEDFYKGSLDGYKSYVFTDALTPAEMVRVRGFVEAEVRGALGIPYYTAGRAIRFEASMGQLSGLMYKTSEVRNEN